VAHTDALDVGQPAAAATPVRVAHLLAKPRLFSADFTSIRHGEEPPRERREVTSDHPGPSIGPPYTPRAMSPDRISLRPQDLKQVLNRYLERLRRHREALNRLNVYPVSEGLAAIPVYLPGGDPGATAAAMAAAIEDVTAGDVTRAVRDARTSAGAIQEGGWLGIVAGDLQVVAPGCAEAASRVLDRMVGNDSEVVTIITGVEAEETITDAITSRFGRAHPKVAVEVVSGGQPQYPYVFGVE